MENNIMIQNSPPCLFWFYIPHKTNNLNLYSLYSHFVIEFDIRVQVSVYSWSVSRTKIHYNSIVILKNVEIYEKILWYIFKLTLVGNASEHFWSTVCRLSVRLYVNFSNFRLFQNQWTIVIKIWEKAFLDKGLKFQVCSVQDPYPLIMRDNLKQSVKVEWRN